MSHSYEEIRSAAFKVIAEDSNIDEFDDLKLKVGKFIDKFDGKDPRPPSQYPANSALGGNDSETLREVFWDMFRQGIVTLGKDEANSIFPFFKVTSHGKKATAGDDYYFITDTSGLEKKLRDKIPNIDDITLLYLRESFQAFRSGCLLSSSVMLGVAAEHVFLKLLKTLEDHQSYKEKFKSVFKQRTILSKIEKFKTIASQDKKNFPHTVRENYATQLFGIQSIIRTYRNESGHPSGQVIDRENAFVNLNLFIPYGKMIHELMDHYK